MEQTVLRGLSGLAMLGMIAGFVLVGAGLFGLHLYYSVDSVAGVLLLITALPTGATITTLSCIS